MIEQEAWLNGPLAGVSPILMPAAHALVQAGRDLARAASSLSIEQLWEKPNNAPAIGFHLQHIDHSIDRLLTYARGEKLSAQQFGALASEGEIDFSIDAAMLTQNAVKRIEEALEAIRLIAEETLFEKRTVGRLELPTNVFGLLFHIAEHTQRHVGQVITTAKIVGKQRLTES